MCLPLTLPPQSVCESRKVVVVNTVACGVLREAFPITVSLSVPTSGGLGCRLR